MKERPILFSGPMVRAILQGRKTQTRRLVKPQPTHLEWFEHQAGWIGSFGKDAGSRDNPHRMVPCPYGRTGDRLWVRESWGTNFRWDEITASHLPIDLSGKNLHAEIYYAADYADNERPEHNKSWRPSIHMPRRASRINLEITAVRVERLQQISAHDALSEGCPYHHLTGFCPTDAIDWYRNLWNSINGQGSWDANPWVWVVEFQKVKGGEA